ncbi:interleukin-1 receptor accessory protein [Stegastes partitus]|uniref:Interleukin-1 receptor accessory protein n=1 Tax=Stegastes partitus TaxID=144197 RepID=A0A9Y4MX12_9TELE|nr:PREDICTED: interleukin-1 receptor accessory protein [Stegastes partitus]
MSSPRLRRASFVSSLLFLFLVGGASPAVGQSSEQTEPMCYDWGESSEAGVSVLEGESGWLSCPLFSHPSVYNYTSTQSAGHTLFWYRLLHGQDLEEPITSSSRLSKDRERLWLQPATSDDTGQYICMLRNKSSCSKIAMRLTVLRRDEAVRGVDCEPPVAVAAAQETIALQGGETLDCPDLQDAAKMADGEPTVTWYHVRRHLSMCEQYPFWNNERQQKGASLRVFVMLDSYQGLYFCTVHYQRRGKTLNFTRSINVTAVYPPHVYKHPSILQPTQDQVFSVKPVSLPSVELGCGLGVTLVLMLLLFVVYHVFWLELLLLYRSWFGTDERHTDDKEYDVYISYARNSEEEQFVLSTLRGVLENELGYSVCIYDRDSLPGGTITDETLSFVARSRRLLVVVSPGYASQGSQTLLELKAGIDGMALGGHLRVILVQYKPVQRQGWVRELRRARVALALVRWQGDKSRELTSRFWKRLRVELPVRRVSRGDEEEEEGSSKEAILMRLHSQNSTNSQTGLISNTVKDPQKVLNCAA